MNQNSKSNSNFTDNIEWEEKAKINPLFAVMSTQNFIESTQSPSKEELKLFFDEGKNKVNQWILPWLQQNNNFDKKRLLDYGCGMGRFIFYLSGIINECYGVDLSHTMIKFARQYLSENVNIKVLEENGRIPFATNYFDFIYSYSVFEHIRQRSGVFKAIAEIGRVLKHGGKVKLHFSMEYPPPFSNSFILSGDTYALNNKTLIYGWIRKFGLPIWRIRLISHNHWKGSRPGYSQLINEFKKNKIRIYGIEDIPDSRLLWFYGIKEL